MTEKSRPSSIDAELVSDNLKGIGHLLCDLSQTPNDPPPLKPEPLYFLGDSILKIQKTVSGHLWPGDLDKQTGAAP